ncbi:NAD(P)-dependent oxidoreductase [Altererythrobacter sp. CC-YST694]|uniref:NAD(P)-dependent oxidoreductase n=1 Tax=Altererythrobacter sp. CC-YST694 TaxID=2755038 RepID=UPI001D02B368|nr:NAD(P)-dependent oxidoreductase [Altererythrobacter sp. CC-YST694]MCB5425711.1 NAD(P)-dependent oxidoreductase [Altererythrobacter sp. CC-YST694]
MSAHLPRLSLIGFGEAGSTFARAGQWSGAATGWDIHEERRALMPECGVAPAADARAALEGAAIVLSLVTADSALPAASDYARWLSPGAIWCDMNSVSPETKRQAAAMVEEAGGRYVDVAVMAPVDPQALSVPLLIAGAAAQDATGMLNALGFANTRVVGDEVGRASAIKMIRSVMVKGLEALTAELVLAADSAGVLDEVLASLDASEKQVSWTERADYNLDRMIVHGLRRAAEMQESAKTLAGLNIAPMMTDNTVAWQQAIGELAILPPKGLRAKIDAIKASPGFKRPN